LKAISWTSGVELNYTFLKIFFHVFLNFYLNVFYIYDMLGVIREVQLSGATSGYQWCSKLSTRVQLMLTPFRD